MPSKAVRPEAAETQRAVGEARGFGSGDPKKDWFDHQRWRYQQKPGMSFPMEYDSGEREEKTKHSYVGDSAPVGYLFLVIADMARDGMQTSAETVRFGGCGR